jgi:hypothetical protein
MPYCTSSFGGARGIRTLDPSYPGYRTSSSHSARPPTSVVVHPELNGRTIDALPSSGIRPRPARWGSWWGSENTSVGSNPSAHEPGAATPRSPPAVQRWGRAVARPLAAAGRLRGRTGVKLPCAHAPVFLKRVRAVARPRGQPVPPEHLLCPKAPEVAGSGEEVVVLGEAGLEHSVVAGVLVRVATTSGEPSVPGYAR